MVTTVTPESQQCMLCNTHQVVGHLDPDSLQWFCENCWQRFTGNGRTCFRCREFSEKGSVDTRDQRWYCFKCWNSYTNVGTDGQNNQMANTAQISNGPGTPMGMSPMPQNTMPVMLPGNTMTGVMNNMPAANMNIMSPMMGLPNDMSSGMNNNIIGFSPMNPMQGMSTGMNPMQDVSGMNNGMNPMMGGMMGMNMPLMNPMMQNSMGLGMPNTIGAMPLMNPMIQNNMSIPNMNNNNMINSNPIMGQKGMNNNMMPSTSKDTGKGKSKIKIKPGTPSTSQGSDNGSKRFIGKIKGFNAKHGYGFLMCDEAKNMYGRDIFMHHAELTQILGKDSLKEIPDHVNADRFEDIVVEFGIQINEKGMPQARDCYLQGKTPNAIKNKA